MLEPDEESGGYVVSCPSIPGCYSQGDTIDEAIANIKEAILLCLEDMESQHQEIHDSSKTLVAKGILKGIDISEKEIAAAKKSLYGKISI
jgi:predicted RNase H-like HicB family nuclease